MRVSSVSVACPSGWLGHLSGVTSWCRQPFPTPECGNDAGRGPDPSAHLLSLRHTQSSGLGHQTRGLFPCMWVWDPQAWPCLRRCPGGVLGPAGWETGGEGLRVEGVGWWVPSSLLVWKVWVQPLRGAPLQEEPQRPVTESQAFGLRPRPCAARGHPAHSPAHPHSALRW